MQHHRQQVQAFLQYWQEALCQCLSAFDPRALFVPDIWQSKLGKGETRTVSPNTIFDAASVNFSHIHGTELPSSALPGRSHMVGKPYIAMGVSTVIHPTNPYVGAH